MEGNIIKVKSYNLAVRIVMLCKHLKTDKKEDVLSKQLLKSGTSIGSNVREAIDAQSKADFTHKFSIALKEANETLYWLELLKETKYINDSEFEKIYDEATQVYKITNSIVRSSKK